MLSGFKGTALSVTSECKNSGFVVVSKSKALKKVLLFTLPTYIGIDKGNAAKKDLIEKGTEKWGKEKGRP